MKKLGQIIRWLLPAASMVATMARNVSAAGVERVEHAGVVYQVFRARPEQIELHWKDESGKAYARFSKLQEALLSKGRVIEMMTNAGIFEPGGIPSGLHVEHGVELRPINLQAGQGNFFLKPNGVFAVAAGKALVMESAAFAQSGIKPDLALQSGPLLLDRGRIHPLFQAGSSNQKLRNGVGVVRKTGEVVFAITEFEPVSNRVNLHGFATFFQHLGCESALFLDGDISQMFVKPNAKLPKGNRLGAFLAITKSPNAR